MSKPLEYNYFWGSDNGGFGYVSENALYVATIRCFF